MKVMEEDEDSLEELYQLSKKCAEAEKELELAITTANKRKNPVEDN